MKRRRSSWQAATPNLAPCLNFSLPGLGHSSPQHCPPHCPQPNASNPNNANPLGTPLSIGEAAKLIGCSVWTIRQTLLPRGLPHFRSGGGKLLFYKSQIIRWILAQQKGETTT